MDRHTAREFITEVATLVDTITLVRSTDTTTVVARKMRPAATYSETSVTYSNTIRTNYKIVSQKLSKIIFVTTSFDFHQLR